MALGEKNFKYFDAQQVSQQISGWQKLCEGTKGLRRKVWTRPEILSRIIPYLVAIFVGIYAVSGNHWAKTAFLGKEVH